MERFETGRRGLIKYLVAGTVFHVSGCIEPRAVLILDEASNKAIHDSVTEIGEDSKAAEIFETVGNETYTETGLAPTLNPDTLALYNGTYHRVGVESENISEDVEYLLRVEYAGDEPVDGEIRYENLPQSDRNALGRILPSEVSEGFEEENTYPYTEDERNNSTLVEPREHTVVYEDSRFSVETEKGPPIDRKRYTYTVEEVAGSRSEFIEWAKGEYGFTLSGLSEGERVILEEAIDGGYYEGSANDDFVSLARAFRDHPALEADEWRGEWLVEYEGTTYIAELRHPPSAIEG